MSFEIQLNQICTKVPSFVPLYNARVRHYIIKDHIRNVYNQFEKYFSEDFNHNDIDWFRVFLLLHDIGKSPAFKAGNREKQYEESIILLDNFKSQLEISDTHLKIYKCLLECNLLGKYMESKVSLVVAFNEITSKYIETGLELDKFFYYLTVYYQCDVASYTKDAGGLPFLEHLFEYYNGEKKYNRETKLLQFSATYFLKYKLLFDKISEYLKTTNQSKNHTIETKNLQVKIIDKIDLSVFNKKKKEIVNDKKNIYIIDTNVFVDYPEIINKIDNQYQIVISAKVIDELDSLKIKLSQDQQKNIQKALSSINRNIDIKDLKMITADLSLLPIDFVKRSPDNLILSVALQFKNDNPIMLTSDNGLQIKCKGFDITTISLKEFLKQNKY